MNVVVFSPYARWTPHLETDLEIIQRHLDQADRVTLLGCDAEMSTCDANPQHVRRLCRQCTGRRLAGLSLLSEKVSVEPFVRLTGEDHRALRDLPSRFADVDALKAYRIGSFDIGYAVLSSVVSQLRDPEIHPEKHAKLIHRTLCNAFIVYRSIANFLEDRATDRFYAFNGRFAPLRAALRACQEKGVTCYTHDRGFDLRHYALFQDTFLHDRAYREMQIREAWQRGGADRESAAARWFQARSAGDGGSWFSFVEHQQASSLPEDWDPQKRNVVIFLSSEDEFVAVGDSWRNPLYRDQNHAIHSIVRSLQGKAGDLHLYLRVHPNLAGVDNHQTRELARIDAPFVTVIAADKPISSYALLRASEKVVTFGSTLGIEAVYWGVPSVLAGTSYYRNLGATYNPDSHAELIDMIGRRLDPKPIDAALIYGYYFATFGTPFKYFVPDGIFSGTFKGRRIKRSMLDRAKTWWLHRAAARRAAA